MNNDHEQSEIRAHWRLLFSATVGIGCSLTSLITYTSGVFLPTLTRIFGWHDAQMLASITIVLLTTSICAPLIGILSDRYGSRKVILGSVTAMGLSWILLACGTGSLSVFYLSFALLAIAGSGTLPITWTRGLMRAFRRKRGLALGIAMIGTGLFGAVVKMFTFTVMAELGWRAGYCAIGMFTLLVVLPVAFFGYYETAEQPDLTSQAETYPPSGLTVSMAVRKKQFWILWVSFFILSLTLAGLAPNLERLIMHSGVSMDVSVRIASMFGIGIIAGRLLTGWLLDKLWAPLVILIVLLPAALVYGLLGHFHSSPRWLFVAITILGAATGVEYDALAYLVLRYFGLRFYSAIYDLIYIAFAIGAGFGPGMFAFLMQSVGYSTLFFGNAILLCIGSALLLLMGRYPRLESEQPVTES